MYLCVPIETFIFDGCLLERGERMRLFRRKKRSLIGGLMFGHMRIKKKRTGRGSKVLKKLEKEEKKGRKRRRR